MIKTPAAPPTIFALASGQGRAGVAVIRLSGNTAGDALCALTGRPLPQPRRADRARFGVPGSDQVLDDGLALWFPAPASFTGEDVAELHIHGGPAVIAAVLATLATLDGLRPAEAGEFTRRAFDNGKLDLTAAEGLADLIAAETEAQRLQAQRQYGGELARLYDGWRDRLVRALALIEAEIDFSDEELPAGLTDQVLADARKLDQDLKVHLADGRRGERLRDGLFLAIVGPPNAGKSSLLNLLARRDAAIVSDIAGTTRDVIEVHLDLGGYPLNVADTAGLRASSDAIESEGVRRALHHAAHADLKLLVLDGSDLRMDGVPEDIARGLIDDDTLIVLNKSDLATLPFPQDIEGRPVFEVSVKTGSGVDELLAGLEVRVADRLATGAGLAPTRERHRLALEDCRAALARVFAVRDPHGEMELMCEDLRLAARALGRITGRIDVEDLLDVIFGEFCIGK